MADVEVKEFGQYIVADPRICHGQWTFKGTRIMVWQVLEYLADNKEWDWISDQWPGSVPKEAISEAIQLARRDMVTLNEEWRKAALSQLQLAG